MGEIPSRLASFWRYLGEEFHLGLLLIAAVGVLAMLVKDRPGALLLGAPPGLARARHVVRHLRLLSLLHPPYLVLALFMTAGLGAILDTVERLVKRFLLLPRAATLLLSVPLMYLAVSNVREGYPLVDRSRDSDGRRIVEAVAEKTAANAPVLHHRRDLTLISP